jgi:pimeloyl-ACP methyl ester carboxylesterase
MAQKISIFRSPESQAQYYAAYETMLQRWPVPFDELYVPTQFGDIHVIASGSPDSPALILFHSAGSGAVQWFRNVESFSQHYRTYAVDVIGEVNKSLTTRKLNKREHFVNWMGELFDGLHIERTDLVGNSFGGLLAFTAALYLPERVKKVVLISPAATFVPIWAWLFHVAYPYKVGYVINSKPIILSGFKWLWQNYPRDETFQRYTELSKVSGFPSNQLMPPVFTDDDLCKIKTPMLLLIGDHEVIYKPERVIQRATRLVAGLKVEIVPNANHNAQVTNPDYVNQRILEFLSSSRL